MLKRTFGALGNSLQTPLGVIVGVNVLWHIIVWVANIKFSYIASLFVLGFDIFAAYYLLDRLTYFFAQFILPIQNQKQRQEIFKRVKNFEAESHGPALFIKNGRVIMHEGEMDGQGPGLIVLDTASAAVLRTDTEIKDTVGPGVNFTQGNEYIEGCVDLRSQWKYVGPNILSQHQTLANTRDGAEVSATISIKFNIKRPKQLTPTESGVISRYGYDEKAVRNAILREIVEVDGEEKKPVVWNEFPAYLVVNIWREYAEKFRSNEMFALRPGGESNLQYIERMINKRVRQVNMEALDDMGDQTTGRMNSREFNELQERGLEIEEVRIHNIYFDSATEDLILSQWRPDWLKNVEQEEKTLNATDVLIGMVAREEASKRFARLITRSFSAEHTTGKPNSFMTLQALIKPLKEFILEQSNISKDKDMKDTELHLRKLDEIWKWLLDNGSELSRSQEGK
jgi:hypothetical protein